MIDAEYVAPPPPPVPEPIPVIPQFNVEVTPTPVIVPEPVEEIVEIVPLIEPEPVPEPEPVAPQPVTPIEPDVFIVKLETGDKITIEPKTDEDEDVFAVFTSFRSTQFFVNDFEESSELLTLVKDKEPEELSWFEQDSGAGMANWVLLTVVIIIVSFSILGCFICVQMRKSKSNLNLQERAIIEELQMAKKEGVAIPDDLQKRLTRFEKGGQDSGKDSFNKGNPKVHPDESHNLGRMTRYAANAGASSLSQSGSKLIRNEPASTPYGHSGLDGHATVENRPGRMDIV